MKTVGEILKEERLKKRYSLDSLENATKIKKEFIEAIEKGKWSELPDMAVVLGFVRTLSTHLGLVQEKTLAILRRDYPPRKSMINPKPDISKNSFWNPKRAFLITISILVIILVGYLGFQYFSFISPPKLEIFGPKEEELINEENIKVSGKTDLDSVVKINDEQVLLNADGEFETNIKIDKNTTEIEIKAISRFGKETKITRKIKVDLNT